MAMMGEYLKNKKVVLVSIIVLLLLLGLLGLGIYLLTGKQEPKQNDQTQTLLTPTVSVTQQSTPTTTPTKEDELNTFTSDTYDFTFKYPKTMGTARSLKLNSSCKDGKKWENVTFTKSSLQIDLHNCSTKSTVAPKEQFQFNTSDGKKIEFLVIVDPFNVSSGVENNLSGFGPNDLYFRANNLSTIKLETIKADLKIIIDNLKYTMSEK